MQQTDKIEFVRVLEGLASIKPGAKLTPEGLDMWWAAMADWSLPEFKHAASHLARSVEFFPNPYHFEQVRKAGRPTAAEAFIRAREVAGGLELGKHGDYTDVGVTSGDPAIDRAVRAIGGYVALAMRPMDTMHFFEKRFAEHYRDIGDAIDSRRAIGRDDKPMLKDRAVTGMLQKLSDELVQ